MAVWTWALIGLGIALLIAVLIVGLFRWLYVKVPANMAFIRTGLGGWKAVTDAGAFVLPIVHNIQWLSLETFKIEVLRTNRDAFILKDRYRVDIGAEFYVKILAESNMIEAASRSLGDKSFSADGIKALVEEKLISAMRSAAAQMELVELHENRRGFALQVKELVTEPLAQNGLGIEDVALFSLDQTDKSQLDPNNIFDAEGLRQITAQTSRRMQERNEIERNTEVAIRRKDVEAVRLKLELEREQSFAEAEQVRQVENHRTEQRSEAERFRYAQELQTREAEIGKEQRVREAELAREVYLVEKERERQLADIARERAIEEAQRAKEAAILQEERKRIVEEEARLKAEAQREEAEQAVLTVTQKAEAERQKQVAVIRALNELEVADRKAKAMERLAEARLKEGQAEAGVSEARRRAENAAELKVIYRDVALRLIENLPEIAREVMEPARHIDSIRVLDVNGLAGGDGSANGGASDPIQRVYQALIGTGAALPIIRELLSFGEGSAAIEKLGETFPELKNLVELRKTREAAS
ncbi:MAG: flotillin [Deltaproteobacteria bacterium]|nr:MAG: flotillin [Deltaproteobacteria bacterium]